jgi:CheY-like chemotaxis protein
MDAHELSILLAEDDEGHAFLIQQNLVSEGVGNKLVHVRDGQEALDYIRCAGAFADRLPSGPLLVLLDINLPRVDGVEVLRQIKADSKTAHLPVIMLTTTDDPREIHRCYELGCDSYVTKSVDYHRFVDAIRRIALLLSMVPGKEKKKSAGLVLPPLQLEIDGRG